MTSADLVEYFPATFDFLVDEKNREWKNIALIPFIDEAKLLKAVESIDEKNLSDAEKKRNSFGGTWVFSYAEEATKGFFKSKYSEGNIELHLFDVAIEQYKMRTQHYLIFQQAERSSNVVFSSCIVLPNNLIGLSSLLFTFW